MSESTQPSIELQKLLAGHALMALAKRVNESIATFSGWLLAAYTGAFSLVIAKFPEISAFVDVGYIRWALILLLVAFAVAIPSRLVAAQVMSATAVHDDVFALSEKHGNFSGPVWVENYLSGLIPFPNRLLAIWMMNKANAGDLAAAGRLIAQLSQYQAMTVWFQMLLGVSAAIVLLCGIHM